MASPGELLELLGRLKEVRSPLARMKLLARGWQSLRRLSGTELRQLASQLGFEGADELVSRLARGKGRVDARFIESLLQKARGADLEELSRAARDLRDPRKRGAVLEKSLDFVVDELAPEPEAPIPSARAEAAAAAAGVTAAATAKAPDAVERADKPPSPPKAPSPPPPVTGAARPAAPPSASPDLPPTLPGPRSTPKAPPAEKPAASPVAAAEAAGPEAPVPAAPKTDARELATRVRETPSAVTRSRLLRGAIESLRGSSAEALRELVTAFPAGWQRRRALVALLERRVPLNLNEAVFLIESLESTHAERWCVTTILERWELSNHEREALIGRHGLSLVRARRLRRSVSPSRRGLARLGVAKVDV